MKPGTSSCTALSALSMKTCTATALAVGETLAEAKDREFNSPTAASEMEGRAAEARAVLLRKLAGAPEGMTARQAHAKLSKRQFALFPQGVAAALAALVADGTATADKEGDGAIFKTSQ